LGRSQVV